MELINLSTKQPEQFEDLADASTKIASGEYGVYGDDIYPVYDNQGLPTKIKGNDLQRALSEGWSLKQTTYDDPITNEEEADRYDKLNAQAAVLGALRGFTLGLSDQALVKLYGFSPEHIRKLRQYNSTVSGVSEIGGAVAPIIASGGTGLIGRAAAKSLPGLLNKVGAFTTAKVATGIGRVAGLAPEATGIAKYVSNLTAKGIGSAVEAAAYGAGEYVTEDALKDPGMQGESLMAHMGSAALTGGILGTIIPATVDSFGLARRKVPALTDWAAKATRVFSGLKPDIIESYIKEPLKYEKALSADEIAEQLTARFNHFDDLVTNKQIDLDTAKEVLDTLKGRYLEYSNELKVSLKDARERVEKGIESLKADVNRSVIPAKTINEVDSLIKGVKEKRDILSGQSYDILGNYPNPENYKLNVDDIIQTVENILRGEKYKIFEKEGVISQVGDVQKKFFNFQKSLINDLKQFKSTYSNLLGFPEIKKFIQGVIDQPLKDARFGEMGTMEQELLKDLRFVLNDKLRFVPGYSEKMLETQKATELYNYLRKRFYGKNIQEKVIKKRLYEIIKDTGNPELNDDLKYLVNGSKIVDGKFRPRESIVDQLTGMKADYSFARTTGNYIQDVTRARMEQGPALKSILKEYDDLLFDKAQLDKVKNPNYLFNLNKAIEQKIYGDVPITERVPSVQMRTAIAKSELDVLKEQRKVFEPYKEYFEAIPKIISAAHKSPERIKAMFEKASRLSDQDFVELVEQLRVQTAFDNSFVNGSRNVNLYRQIGQSLMSPGGVVGTAIGGTAGGIVGAGLGAVMGAFVDFYGPAIAKKVLFGLSKLKKNFSAKDYRQAIIDNVPESSRRYLDNSAKVLGRVEKDYNKTVHMIEKSLSDYLTRPISAMKVSGTKYITDDREFEKLQAETQDYINKREAFNSTFYDDNQEIIDIAPNTMDSYFATYNRAIDFLDSKLPKGNPADIFGDSIPARIEMVKFSDYLRYVKNPLSLLDEMRTGNISQEGIDVVKNVYPSIYNNIVEQITAQLSDPKLAKKISMEKRLQLKRMFGLNFYPTFDYRTFSTLQNTNSVKQQQEAQEKETMGKLVSRQGRRGQTDLNRIMNKNA